jgi:hypothetical protein
MNNDNNSYGQQPGSDQEAAGESDQGEYFDDSDPASAGQLSSNGQSPNDSEVIMSIFQSRR